MSDYQHFLTQWNHVLWFEVLTYVAVGLALVMGVIAAAISRRRSQPLPPRMRIAAVCFAIYLICLIGLVVLGPASYPFVLFAALLGSWLLYQFIRHLRRLSAAPDTHTRHA